MMVRAPIRVTEARAWPTSILEWGGSASKNAPADLDAPGRVGWHELLAADWEKAFAFYREVFAWQRARSQAGEPSSYQLFSTAGQTGGARFTNPATTPPPLLPH